MFADESGRKTAVPKLDNTGITGNYLTSEGKQGNDAWGTRARWCMLSGGIGDTPITIAILDHPGNPGYPTYWHARNYGLNAANPFGEHDFYKDKSRDGSMTIPAGGKMEFRYRGRHQTCPA